MDLMSLMVKVGADITGATKGLSEVENKMSGTAKKASSFADKLKSGFSAVKTGALAMGAGFTAAAATVTKLATSAAATTDHIDKMSQKVGLSRKAYQEMDFIMSQSGGSVDSLAAGMKTLRSSMTAAQSGTEANVKQFKALGVSVTDAKGNLRGTEDVMFDTIAALQKIPNETERAAKATQLFGKAGTELIPLLNSGAGSIEEMRQKANELGLVLGDDAIDAGVKLTDTIDQVKRSFSSITTRIGVSVMPMVQSVLEVVLDNMPVIQKVMTAVFGVIGKVVSGGVKLFGALVKGIGNVARAVGGKLKPVLQTIGGIPKLIGQLFKGNLDIPSLLANLFTGGKVTWVANYSIPRFLDQFVKPALKSGLEKLFGDGSAADSIISGISKAINAVTGVVNMLKEAFEPTIAAIKQFAGTVSGLFSGTSSLSDVGASLLNIFKSAWTGIQSIDWAQLGSTIWEAIKGAFSAVVEWYKTLFSSAADMIKSIDWAGLGETVWGAIKGAFSTVVGWFKSLFGGENGVGVKGSILDGIDWAGLGESIWNYITAAFSAVVDFYKPLFEDAKEAIAGIEWAQLGTDIWNAIKGAFSAIGTWFMERFEAVKLFVLKVNWAQLGANIWDTIKAAFSAIGEWFKEKFEFVVTKIGEIDWAKVGTDIWSSIRAAFLLLGTWFKERFEFAVTKIKEIDWAGLGSTIWEAIKGAMSAVTSWLPEGFQTALDGVATFFTVTVPAFVNKGMMYFNAFRIGVLKPLGDYIGGAFLSAWAAIKDYWETDLSPRLQGLKDAFDTFKTNVLEPIATFLSDTFKAAWEGLQSLFGSGEGGTGVNGSLKELSRSFHDLYIKYIRPVAEFVAGTFSTVWETWKGVINGIITFLTGVFSGDWKMAWQGLVDAFGSIFDGIKDLVKKPLNAVIDFLNSLITKVEFTINKIVRGINGALQITIPGIKFKWADGPLGTKFPWYTTDYSNPMINWRAKLSGVTFSRIQKLAKGGIVRNGGDAIVGEAGAEYLRVVNGQAIVTPIKGMSGGGDTYNTINIYQQPGQDPRELAEIIQRELVRIGRQQKAVYA